MEGSRVFMLILKGLFGHLILRQEIFAFAYPFPGVIERIGSRNESISNGKRSLFYWWEFCMGSPVQRDVLGADRKRQRLLV